jgi:hypothetical protein
VHRSPGLPIAAIFVSEVLRGAFRAGGIDVKPLSNPVRRSVGDSVWAGTARSLRDELLSS